MSDSTGVKTRYTFFVNKVTKKRKAKPMNSDPIPIRKSVVASVNHVKTTRERCLKGCSSHRTECCSLKYVSES